MIKVDWQRLKQYIAFNQSTYQWAQTDDCYIVRCNDSFGLWTIIPIANPPVGDQVDFETNYKSTPTAAGSQFDTDGAAIVRNKAAKRGWTFSAMAIEFQTANCNSLISNDSQGNPRTFITMTCYDANNNVVTNPALNSTIVQTNIDFEPPYDYEIIGGSLRHNPSITTDVRLWIVGIPDIPASLGGSKELGSGVNLKYLSPGNELDIDGRVTKYLTYDPVNHTNKLRMILKYPVGDQENIMIVIQLYKQ